MVDFDLYLVGLGRADGRTGRNERARPPTHPPTHSPKHTHTPHPPKKIHTHTNNTNTHPHINTHPNKQFRGCLFQIPRNPTHPPINNPGPPTLNTHPHQNKTKHTPTHPDDQHTQFRGCLFGGNAARKGDDLYNHGGLAEVYCAQSIGQTYNKPKVWEAALFVCIIYMCVFKFILRIELHAANITYTCSFNKNNHNHQNIKNETRWAGTWSRTASRALRASTVRVCAAIYMTGILSSFVLCAMLCHNTARLTIPFPHTQHQQSPHY